MSYSPLDPTKPDIRFIQDQFNDPETIKLWRAGKLPQQIREREEAEAKAKKNAETMAENRGKP